MKQQIIVPPSGDTTVIDIETIVTSSVQPSPVNKEPVAMAGADIQAKLPEDFVTLDGSLSSDPDGMIVGYKWNQIAGPAVVIESPTLSTTKLKSLVAGQLEFELIVTDNKGATSRDTVKVEILPAAITPKQTAFTFPIIPYTDPDFNAPGRGAEQWHSANVVDIPVQGVKTKRLDKYYRFQAYELQNGPKSYTWTPFDQQINDAIDNGQKFSFGVMTCFSDAEVGRRQNYSGGGFGAIPEFVHMAMQAETVKDWKQPDGTWIPNWNSPAYLNWLDQFNADLNTHINNTEYKGVKYKDVIGYIDIRGYGQWGEWNSVFIVDNISQYPAGTRATVASLKRIVDSHIKGFPDFPLVAMIAAFDANYMANIMNPPEIAEYVLTAKNNWGPIGWRRDQWGSTEAYLPMLLENNNRSFNGGQTFKTRIMDRWKTSYIVGEPTGSTDNYGSLEKQMRLYHATSFGNGNYMQDPIGSTASINIRNASKAAGYRIEIPSGVVIVGDGLEVQMNIYNMYRDVAGPRAPALENWDIVFRLADAAGNLLWTGKSAFNLKRFSGDTFVIDKFPAAPTNAAYLYIHVADPKGYRKPMPLYIKGAMVFGGIENSYQIKLNQ